MHFTNLVHALLQHTQVFVKKDFKFQVDIHGIVGILISMNNLINKKCTLSLSMKRVSLFWHIFVLFFTVQTVSIKPSTPLIEPSDELAHQIIAEARRNMPSDVQACKSLKEVEALIRMEESVNLWAIKHAFNIPYERWKQLLADIKTRKYHLQHVYYRKQKPVIDHSLASINQELYANVVSMLKKYHIHPHSVTIQYLKQFHDENPNLLAFAHTQAMYGDIAAGISFRPSSRAGEVGRDLMILVPLHECMHLWDIHTIQVRMLKTLVLNGHISDDDFSKHTSVKEWRKTLEKICDLLPLIKFKEPKFIELYLQYCIEVGKSTIVFNGQICWNQPDDDATHPNPCGELLPWVLKIHDLMKLNLV
jgi:hypothetical protein